MTLLLSVTAVSAAGWIISQLLSRSAARRHLVLSAALVACLLLPIVFAVRSETDWTLLAIRSAGHELEPSAHAMAVALPEQSDEKPISKREVIAIGKPPSSEFTSEMIRETSAENNLKPPPLYESMTSSSEPLRSATHEASPSLVSARSNVPINWAVAKRFAAAVYAIVGGVLLVRLLLLLAVTQRLKRGARQVDVLGNGVHVLEADVVCPLAVGFGRPAIILPLQFRNKVGPEELGHVLAHETEHLRRGDHWMLLMQRLIAAVYWPIITVHWLNRGLDRAREELCDNAVLAGRDPTAYGQTLLRVAQLASRRSPAVPLASSVIAPGDLERRVASLLDNCRDRRPQVAPRARWATAAILTSMAVLAGTTRLAAQSQEEPPNRSPAAQAATTELPTPNPNIDWTGIPKVDPDNPTLHRGVVFGPKGEPVAGASIYAASTIELLELADEREVGVDDLGPVRAVTDTQGRFEFNAEDLSWVTATGERKRWETLLVATKDGLAPGWLRTWGADRSVRSHWPRASRNVALRMRRPAVLTGRLLLEGDAPLAGARIRLTGLMAPIEYDLDKHIRQEEKDSSHPFPTMNYAETISRPQVLPGLVTEATTDDDGRFELPGLPRDYIAQIDITHPQAETTTLRVANRSIDPVYREPYFGDGEPKLMLYGSGFTANLPPGLVLRGRVTEGWLSNNRPAAGVIVARSMSGRQFRTDANGRFEVTGLRKRPQGYDLAFAGSFAAPYASRRQQVVPGEDADVILIAAVPYRLKVVDADGEPLDREVYSIEVQEVPGEVRNDIKPHFNDAERVAPGVYEGIVPLGPGAVLVKRGAKTDRPAAVDPKAFFAPGRSDWTLEEQRYAYGDAWRIARPSVRYTDINRTSHEIDQLELAAVAFTNAQNSQHYNGVIELRATVHSDPPVKVTLVDEAGEPVAGARVDRQLERYDEKDLPASFPVYGLHPERAEFLVFQHLERGLIGTLSTTWTNEPIRVVMRPAARIFGRFTDATGKPNFDFGVRVLGEGVMPDMFVAGRMNRTTDELGKRKGDFRLVVPPGIEVRGEFVRKTADRETRPAVGVAFGPLIPKPGETVDLGNLTVP